MTDSSLSIDDFQIGQESVRGHWAPIYMEPIMGSGERFTIGIAVVGESGFAVVAAGKLSRFQCLYDSRGKGVEFMALAALDGLREDLAVRGLLALSDPRPPMSGIHVGDLREGAGSSLEAIARTWLVGMSSFASERCAQEAEATEDGDTVRYGQIIGRDKLARQVASQVIERRPGLAGSFRRDVLPSPDARSKRKLPIVQIDFHGSLLAANFRSIDRRAPFKSIDDLKRPLWNLDQCRTLDGPFDRADKRYELIVCVPAPDDQTDGETRMETISDALSEVEEQAKRKDLRVLRLHRIADITNHVLAAESPVNGIH